MMDFHSFPVPTIPIFMVYFPPSAGTDNDDTSEVISLMPAFSVVSSDEHPAMENVASTNANSMFRFMVWLMVMIGMI